MANQNAIGWCQALVISIYCLSLWKCVCVCFFLNHVLLVMSIQSFLNGVIVAECRDGYL